MVDSWPLRRVRARSGPLAVSLATVLLSGASTARAASDDFEVRAYLDFDARAYQHTDGDLRLRLRPMGRAELRFRSEGLVYTKMFLGTRLDVFPWLFFQVYYSHKDLLYSDKPRKQAHMAVLDPIFKLDLGMLRLLDRNGLEWHVTDRFFRYRQYLEARLLPVSYLGPFLGGELRVDSDESRVNMLELRTGLELRPSRGLFLRVFYYLEASRRHAPEWHLTHILGLLVAARV